MTNLTDVYNFVYDWLEFVINNSTSIGTITVTNGSKTVTGTDFITNGIIQVNSYIRLGENYWGQVSTIDSETMLTLKNNYRGATGTGIGYYSDVGMEIIIGSQNVSSSDKRYIVIHEPPVSNRRQGNTQNNSIRSVDIGGGVLKGRVSKSNTYRCSISLEEVQGQDLLSKLEDTIEDENVVALFKASGDISFEEMLEGAQNTSETGNFFEKRYIQDVVLLYTIESQYDGDYIETVDFTGTYNRGG